MLGALLSVIFIEPQSHIWEGNFQIIPPQTFSMAVDNGVQYKETRGVRRHIGH